MKATNQTCEPAAGRGLRREIERFFDTVQLRSHSVASPQRRGRPRHHRSWPLLVSAGEPDGVEVSAALHDADEGGLSFLTSEPFEPGAALFIKLFWCDPAGRQVPAKVVHVEATAHGFLIGCEFVLDN